MGLFANALFAICKASEDGGSVNWCDVRFPALEDGSRLSLDYLSAITGLPLEELRQIDVQSNERN